MTDVTLFDTHGLCPGLVGPRPSFDGLPVVEVVDESRPPDTDARHGHGVVAAGAVRLYARHDAHTVVVDTRDVAGPDAAGPTRAPRDDLLPAGRRV